MNKFAVGTFVAAVLALFGVGGYAAYENHETNKKIGKTADELKNATVRDISESMIRETVSRAAEEAVSRYIDKDNDEILRKAKSKLDADIFTMVQEQYGEAKRGVTEKIAAEVSKLDDPEGLKRSVRKRAEDILVNRFDSDLADMKRKAENAYDDANNRYERKLEDISDKFEDKLNEKLEGYSDNLASMKKVYESIERAFGGNRDDRGGKEIRFTLG